MKLYLAQKILNTKNIQIGKKGEYKDDIIQLIALRKR